MRTQHLHMASICFTFFGSKNIANFVEIFAVIGIYRKSLDIVKQHQNNAEYGLISCFSIFQLICILAKIVITFEPVGFFFHAVFDAVLRRTNFVI